MYGILSGRREGRARKVYSYTALAGAVCAICLPILLEFIAPEIRHLPFLSATVFFVSAFFAWQGYRKVWTDVIYFKRIVPYLYIYTFHLIVLSWYNDFHLLYFVVLLFGIQLCSFSFREDKPAWRYLIIACAISMITIALSGSLLIGQKVQYSILVIFCLITEYVLSGNKAAIISHMRIHRDVLVALSQKTENALFVTSLNGKIIDMNLVSHDMFGYSADELINQDFEILRKTPLTKVEIEFGLEAIRKDSFWTSQTILKTKSGEEMHAYISIGKIEQSDLQFLVYRVRDITAQIKSQEELIRAKETAEAAVIAKSRFVATMSHEIRTPLNGVIGMANLLQQTNLSERQQDYADTIQKSGQSLMVLINDILDYSKLESGKLILEEQRADIREIIFEVCSLLRPHAEKKGLKLTLEVDQQVPDFFSLDIARLKQMLLNLIGNAVKFTDKGFVKVVCRSQNLYEQWYQLNIDIIDSGIGIPADKINSLFELFSQVDSSTSRKYGGTGLGLTISRQIAELMNGSILVSSKPQSGSTFTIQIRAKENTFTPTSEIEVQEKLQMDGLSDKKFLIVEDNSVNQKVLSYMLDLIGIEADIVSNGKLAVEAILNGNYDLVFMDVQMPEMDGIEATRVIKGKIENTPYIIAITANHSPEDRNKCLDAGMDDFISKPFVATQIRTALNNWKQES